jgi:hypothetical protein
MQHSSLYIRLEGSGILTLDKWDRNKSIAGLPDILFTLQKKTVAGEPSLLFPPLKNPRPAG